MKPEIIHLNAKEEYIKIKDLNKWINKNIMTIETVGSVIAGIYGAIRNKEIPIYKLRKELEDKG